VGAGERFSPNILYKPQYMATAFSPLAYLEENSKKFRKSNKNVNKVSWRQIFNNNNNNNNNNKTIRTRN
jgi:hypothetical protein